MTNQQIQTAVAKALNVDIEKLAREAGKDEHNVREAWNATITQVEQFATKYVAN